MSKNHHTQRLVRLRNMLFEAIREHQGEHNGYSAKTGKFILEETEVLTALAQVTAEVISFGATEVDVMRNNAYFDNLLLDEVHAQQVPLRKAA